MSAHAFLGNIVIPGCMKKLISFKNFIIAKTKMPFFARVK